MRKLTLFTLLLFLVSACFFFRPPKQTEPVFQTKPVSAWIIDLTSTDYQARGKAKVALQNIGADAVFYLVDALQKKESTFRKLLASLSAKLHLPPPNLVNAPLLRERAAEELGDMGPLAHPAIPALVNALRETDPNALLEIKRSLRRLAPASLPHLTESLRHGNGRVRQGVAEILRDLGPQAISSAPHLLRAIQDHNPSVRASAASALGSVSPGQARSIEGLIAALNDRVPTVRQAAARALGKSGPTAKHLASSALQSHLHDPEIPVSVAAAHAIWHINPQADLVVPPLVAALPDPQAGWEAALILGEIGPSAASAVPALIESLKSEQVPSPLRSPPSSAIALGKIGQAAVTNLLLTLTHPQARIRTSAAIALGFIGPPARMAIPQLFALLSDNDEEVRQASTLSLVAIDPENKDLVPSLKELTHASDIFLSAAAAAELRRLDPTTTVASE